MLGLFVRRLIIVTYATISSLFCRNRQFYILKANACSPIIDDKYIGIYYVLRIECHLGVLAYSSIV